MKPEQQRIAIAEACGWKRMKHSVYGFDLWHHEKFWPPANPDLGTATNDLPDYLNDLNAIHEAEKVLTSAQKLKYADRIFKMTPVDVLYLSATAAQRAEAFLRTLGKWTDSPAGYAVIRRAIRRMAP